MNALQAKAKNRDMTEGPLFFKILLFVLPIVLTNLLQTFYNAADMMVVSLSAEENAVGAIGTTGATVYLIFNIFIGLSIGANVVVARRIGARDGEGVSRAVHTALVAGLILGFAGMIAGTWAARPLLRLMGAEEDLLDLAVLYIVIFCSGLPFVSLSNFLISIFRAKGDPRTPFIILAISGLFNVGLNLFFVLVTGLSVEGVALATVISNLLSTILLLWRLTVCRDDCRFSFHHLGLDWKALREMAMIGLPASIQGTLFSISNMLIQSSVISVDKALAPGSAFQPVVKGNAAASNLEGFSYTATNSVYQAAITFTGQNAGAKKYDRIWRVMGCCYLITTVIALIFGGGTYLFQKPLLSLYGVHPSEDALVQMAYSAAQVRILYMMPLYFILAAMEVGSGVLRGLGRSLTSTAVSLIGICLFRVIWIYTVFRSFGTLETVYLSYPISWILTALAHFTCAAIALRLRQKKQKRERPAT